MKNNLNSQYLLFVFIVFSIPAIVTATPLVYDQSAFGQKNSTTWDYFITVPGEPGPTGIYEIIPPGFTLKSSNIPDDQIEYNNSRVTFALTEGGDLSFIITGSEESEGLLSGSKVNYLKDEIGLLSPLFLSNGSVSSGEINQSVSPEQENPKKKSPGFAFFISTLALIITSGYYAGRRQ